ncbi:MAG: VWA domain-containing protein, partial [Sandaracinaceae bacterium]|nr:VWA domain-containing protein [Sandaracinaceae bacterium]
MGRTAKAALMALLCGWGASAAGAQAPGGWVGGAPYQTRVVVGADGSTYVGIWVQAPQMPVARARAPMAVSLVIDTSGSMAGDKIENARMAASSLLETLSDGDVVSLYAFSDGVVELAPPTVLSAASRGLMMQRVRALAAMGGTNMWDGMQIAVRRMSEAPPSHPLRRVFLISDGRANVGPSDPASLGALAARATEWGTQVTAIGVGTDYDQTTLTAMAVQSAGRLYHLGQPYEMASILQNELQLLSRSVALNAYLEVEPAPGVLILE